MYEIVACCSTSLTDGGCRRRGQSIAAAIKARHLALARPGLFSTLIEQQLRGHDKGSGNCGGNAAGKLVLASAAAAADTSTDFEAPVAVLVCALLEHV